MQDDQLLNIINDYKTKEEYKNLFIAEDYYNGKHDILKRKRTVIGENGVPKEVLNIPNNKIVDNVFAKLVDQKTNYLLSMPIVLNTENDIYLQKLNTFFDRTFHRLLKNVCEDSLKFGTGYIFVNYDENNKLCVHRLNPLEVIPIWKDQNQTELDSLIRIVSTKKENTKIVEVFEKDFIYLYTLKKNKLELIEIKPYFFDEENIFAFEKLPIIPFKYNSKRIPIITRVKSLQDGINKILSDFQNNLEEDCRNTVLVLQNFDGTNLSEFRKNLSEYGVVKVKTVDGQQGDVKTLNVTVNSDNYKTIIDMMKKDIIENGRGFDLKNENTFSSMNKMNIKSLYTDIDLDARGMEIEFTSSILDLIWFLNVDIYNKFKEDYFDEYVNIIFNKDTIVNESDVIEDCKNSIGILDMEVIKDNHPWTL